MPTGDRHHPKSLTQNGKMTMRPRSRSLTAKSWQSGLQPQRLLSSFGLRQYRKVPTIAPSVRLLKTRRRFPRSQKGQAGFS